MKATSPVDRLYSVDALMRNTAKTLVKDFQDNLGDPCFCSDFLMELRSGSIARVRETAPALTDEMSVAEYKATYQIQSVLKRYRFEKDTYSDKELEEKAITGFLDTQSRLAEVDLDGLPWVWQLVLNRAADYIAATLGEYSDEEHRDLCRFGRKASVGVPSRLACEAARWELPISGSRKQISWFDSEMSQVPIVQNYWRRVYGSEPNRSTYKETSSLTLTLVPKTFKSLRAIMPNTTIGSYMSYGLGEMMRKRLKRKGYDIRTLQMEHRNLACLASKHNKLTTADLSSASDSITVALVKRLFPPSWFEILSESRIGAVVLPNKQCVESLTFCTMGIGYTFPLQTLVFLSLLKAIQSTLVGRQDEKTISVYGDDMIYPSAMHPLVVRAFEKFGFVLNVEKTFADGHFRESCGGDYYHGVDVRPFQPRNGSASVGCRTYEAILYKFTNTLLARWSEYEIGKTLQYLVTEIESVTGKVKLVPQDFPDDSGVKCSALPPREAFLSGASVSHPKHKGHGIFQFTFLRHVSAEREEKRHDPYYWARLRNGLFGADPHWADDRSNPGRGSVISELINLTCNVKPTDSPLIERPSDPTKYYRHFLTGVRLRRTSTFVTESHSGRYKRQSGFSRFEDRR